VNRETIEKNKKNRSIFFFIESNFKNQIDKKKKKKKIRNKMKVLILKGHERGLNCLRFNREGDLLFSSSKDQRINCWRTDTGERVGSYQGHTGAIWDVDVDRRTERLLSASSDNSTRLWNAETGKELFVWESKLPVRSVHFSVGEKMFLTATDNVLSNPSAVQVYKLADGLTRDQEERPLGSFECGRFKVTQARWGPLNERIFTVGDSAKVHVWDADSGKLISEIDDHTDAVNSIEFSADRLFFLTASSDHTARLYDTRSLELIKTYKTGRPCNGASISPLMDHVLIAGGQPASKVTTTNVDPRQFAARFYHKVLEEELGLVMGHFGTVNCATYSPSGRQFCTGGEDGYVRLNILDDEYFDGLSDKTFFARQGQQMMNK
jgi:translation initiation factor 3 subunit I